MGSIILEFQPVKVVNTWSHQNNDVHNLTDNLKFRNIITLYESTIYTNTHRYQSTLYIPFHQSRFTLQHNHFGHCGWKYDLVFNIFRGRKLHRIYKLTINAACPLHGQGAYMQLYIRTVNDRHNIYKKLIAVIRNKHKENKDIHLRELKRILNTNKKANKIPINWRTTSR